MLNKRAVNNRDELFTFIPYLLANRIIKLNLIYFIGHIYKMYKKVHKYLDIDKGIVIFAVCQNIENEIK